MSSLECPNSECDGFIGLKRESKYLHFDCFLKLYIFKCLWNPKIVFQWYLLIVMKFICLTNITRANDKPLNSKTSAYIIRELENSWLSM